MSMPFVYLWDAARHGTPKSYEQAVDRLGVLRNTTEEAVSDQVVAFGHEFGRFIDNSGDDSWLNVLGGTVAYAQGCQSAVLRLELPDTDWQAVLVELVELAGKHGLVALHEEGATLFLPNGKVLPSSRAKPWNGLKSALKQEGGFPQTLGQFKKWLTPQVEMMLARHGEWEKLGQTPWGDEGPAFVCRKGSLSSIYIYMSVWKEEGKIFFNLKFEITNKMVSDICCRFRFVCGDTVCGGGALNSVLGYNMHGNICELSIVNSSDALRILGTCEQALFPALDHALSIEGLDKLLNGDADPRYRHYFHNFVFKPQCLIVARLAGNEGFEDLAKELAVPTGWYGNDMVWKDEWPRLISYLRDEVSPLV